MPVGLCVGTVGGEGVGVLMLLVSGLYLAILSDYAIISCVLLKSARWEQRRNCGYSGLSIVE